MNINDVTPEQREKAMACTTPEELIEFIQSEGMELSVEQLQQISGGSIIDWDSPLCVIHD